ncbi:MAG: glycosyltransferase, partial [Methylocella sp.]
VVEGMLAGKPIVASKAGGVLEIIEDGVDGVLVTPNDALALRTALGTLLKTQELSERLAAAGRIKALRKFSLEACISSVEKAVCLASRGQ